jgi:transcriptional regulator with XRE-family HTH domain
MLWDWVKAERRRRAWTQEDLSERADLAIRVIRAGEQGQRLTATTETLGKLARAFGLTIDDLLVAASGQPLTPQPPEVYLAALRALGVPPDTLADLIALAAADAIPAEKWREFVAMAQWRLAQEQDARRPQERRRRDAPAQSPADVPPDEPAPGMPDHAPRLTTAQAHSH